MTFKDEHRNSVEIPVSVMRQVMIDALKDYIKDGNSMKVSYKGVTGTPLKLEHSLIVRYGPCVKREKRGLHS